MGGLWAAGDPAASRGRHPEGAPGSYGPAPAGMKKATEGANEGLQFNKKVFRDPKTIQDLIKLLKQ